MANRTLSLDFLKQSTNTNGGVTRRGEFGEQLTVIPYAAGSRMVLKMTSPVYLKGITAENKYVEIRGVISGTTTVPILTFTLTKNWNSAAGNFKVAYVEIADPDSMTTSTVNLDWFVLDNATITGNDEAHYVDALQKLIDELQAKADKFMADMALQLDATQGRLDELDADITAKIIQINNELNTINTKIEAALEEFRAGNFYTKTEADARFMLKGEIPDSIQKFKLTSDDGLYLPLPSGITSITELAKYTGYFYMSRNEAMTMTDQASLPVAFRNAGLYIFMPVGMTANAYRYQEIRLNDITNPRMAFRNTNGTSVTKWVEVADAANVTTNTTNISTQGAKITALETLYTNQANKVENLELRDKIMVYKEKSLPNYGAGWDGVNATECRFDFKRVGNRVTLNARMNVTDVTKFLHGGTGTMDQIYKIPVGFRQEVDAPFFNTAISTNQWAFATNAARNYQGVVEQSGYIRWTTNHTGNHYLTATYFTEDPYPTEGVLGTGQVRYFTPEANGSLEFGGDW